MRRVPVIFILQVRDRSASAGVRIQRSRPDTAVQATGPPLRLLVPDTGASRCRLPRRTQELEALGAMAESNPLRGFPRLRRAAVSSAGRWGGGEAERLRAGRRYCSRKGDVCSPTQRLCFQQRGNCLFLGDAAESRRSECVRGTGAGR